MGVLCLGAYYLPVIASLDQAGLKKTGMTMMSLCHRVKKSAKA
jgi:hypothetical protein